jgi:signal transduction histidine kinase
MDARSPVPPTIRPPWDGVLAPWNLATYVMWLAVTIHAIDWTALANGSAPAWVGTGCLVAAIALFAMATRENSKDPSALRRSVRLIVGEGVAIVAASWLMREGLLSILLTIVAAQLYARTHRVNLLIAVMACLDVATVLSWLPLGVWTEALMIFLPVTGQAFAAALVHYAGSLERARDELARVNAELLATRALLDESARGQERLKLSRELHDVAGHKLTALKLILSRLARDAQVGGREEMTTAAHLAEELLTDVRAVVTELRKHDGIDVRAGLEAMTARISGVRFVIDIPETARASSVETAEALLRCAQEGITNALRHGAPTTITIECRRQDDHVELRVRDDGLRAPRIRFGNGLTGMRERIEGVGGRLQVGAAAERGVELVASVPMADSK